METDRTTAPISRLPTERFEKRYQAIIPVKENQHTASDSSLTQQQANLSQESNDFEPRVDEVS